MKEHQIKKIDPYRTYRIKSLPTQFPTIKSKDKNLSISYTTLVSQNIEFSEKIKRNVATEMTQKCTINDSLRSSSNGLKEQDLK